MTKRWKRPGRKVELILGGLEDFEKPAYRLHAYVRDARQAEQALVLAAGSDHTDPIGFVWLARGE